MVGSDDRIIRVAILTPQLSVGGTEKHILKLCKAFPAGRIRPYVICANPENRTAQYARELQDIGIPVSFHSFSLREPLSLMSVTKLIASEKIEIIHSFCYGNTLWDSLVFSLSPAKIMISERRNLQHWRKGSGIGLWERVRNRLSSRIVANSSEVKKTTLTFERLEDASVIVIHNGLEPLSLTTGCDLSLRKKIGYQDNDFIIVNVANLKEVKRQEDIVLALAALRDKEPGVSWKLILVGRSDQNYKEKLVQLVSDLALEPQVLFFGEIREPSKILDLADVFVLSSEAEGFSNALLEALASGLPAIATKVGGNLDLIKEDENGYLYTPRDPQQLAFYLRKLWSDPQKRNLFKANALKTSRNFSIDNTVQKYMYLYEQLLSRWRA